MTRKQQRQKEAAKRIADCVPPSNLGTGWGDCTDQIHAEEKKRGVHLSRPDTLWYGNNDRDLTAMFTAIRVLHVVPFCVCLLTIEKHPAGTPFAPGDVKEAINVFHQHLGARVVIREKGQLPVDVDQRTTYQVVYDVLDPEPT